MQVVLAILYSIAEVIMDWAALSPKPKNKFWGTVHTWAIRAIILGVVIAVPYLIYLWVTL